MAAGVVGPRLARAKQGIQFTGQVAGDDVFVAEGDALNVRINGDTAGPERDVAVGVRVEAGSYSKGTVRVRSNSEVQAVGRLTGTGEDVGRSGQRSIRTEIGDIVKRCDSRESSPGWR